MIKTLRTARASVSSSSKIPLKIKKDTKSRRSANPQAEASTSAFPAKQELKTKKSAQDKINIVYKKTHTDVKKGTYTGRTSGTGDINKPQDVERILYNRDRNHHMNKEGYNRAEMTHKTTNSSSSRGQEQKGIDLSGGAKSTGGTSGNKINGIAKKNPKRQGYIDAAKKEFGK